MSQLITREKLLATLESVMAGVMKRETVEQSSCFIFNNGYVSTYSDEVACFADCPLKLTAAIPADPFIALLRKMTDTDLKFEVTESQLIVKGSRGKAQLTFEAEIKSPVATITPPEEWTDLAAKFIPGLSAVMACVSTDETKFALTCVHITNDHVEATDRFQLTRYRVKSAFGQEFLIRGAAVKAVVQQDMAQFAESDEWVWFRNPLGLIIATRRYLEPYPEIEAAFEMEAAKPATLPETIGEISERCAIFSAIGTTQNKLRIKLKPGRIYITGEGAAGSYKEHRDIEYDGEVIEFLMAPELLPKVIKNGNIADVSNTKLRIQNGRHTYITALGTVAKSEGA